MGAEVEGEVLRNRQGDARRKEAFDDRVRGRVQDEHELAGSRASLQPAADARDIGGRDAHRGEDDVEPLLAGT